jgi:hypothetical protein
MTIQDGFEQHRAHRLNSAQLSVPSSPEIIENRPFCQIAIGFSPSIGGRDAFPISSVRSNA